MDCCVDGHLTNPEDLGERLHDQIILTALAFAPAVLVRPMADSRRREQDATVMRLRDSLTYRGDALAWHVSLISRLRKAAVAHLQEVVGRDPNAPGDMLQISTREQQFAFDDVVFNAIALLDYVGNVVAFSLYGEPHQKAKWKKAEQFARDAAFEQKETGGTRISDTDIGRTIRGVHRTLYSRLVEYRSELLHYLTVPAGGKVSTNFRRNEAGSFDITAELGATAPEAFSKWCTIPEYKDRPKEIPIEVAGAWVRDEAQRAASLILKELERELRREAGRDPDGKDRVIQML